MSSSMTALPLTAERFAPFGDVLEAVAGNKKIMNEARFERYGNLAQIDIDSDDGGQPSISIARCRSATSMPYRIDMLERHPRGTQAFMPLTAFQFVVVVAPAGEDIETQDIAAFVTNGRQGINYHKGVWHIPIIAMQEGQEFMIVDRGGNGDNCDEHYLGDPILVDI